jgi:GLPGLI family protein
MFSSEPKKNIFPLLSILTFFFFSLSSCSTKHDNKNISEGEIEYNIDYLDNSKENPLIMLLPKKMTTEFNENSSFTIIEGFLGTFKLCYLSKSDIKQHFTLFQMMDKKYYYQAEANKLSFGYQNMKDLHIVYTDITKKIAGYNCKQAIASFPDGQFSDIEIFYTDEIELKHPNQNNPFHEIDGVLMQFTANLMGINMKITTSQVKKKKINPAIFAVPNGYTKVTLDEMEKIVKSYNLEK